MTNYWSSTYSYPACVAKEMKLFMHSVPSLLCNYTIRVSLSLWFLMSRFADSNVQLCNVNVAINKYQKLVSVSLPCSGSDANKIKLIVLYVRIDSNVAVHLQC